MKQKQQWARAGTALALTGGIAAAFAMYAADANETHGADMWEPSGIKVAEYQLSGAVEKPWTNIPISTVSSAGGFDLSITKKGLTFFAVSTEDHAGNTAIDMEVVNIGEYGDTISPIHSIQYQLEGASQQGWTTYTTPFKITKEGVTKINVRVEDKAGNSGTLTREVRLDKSSPINNAVTITLD